MWDNKTKEHEQIQYSIHEMNSMMLSFNVNFMDEMESRMTEIKDYLIAFNTTRVKKKCGIAQ